MLLQKYNPTRRKSHKTVLKRRKCYRRLVHSDIESCDAKTGLVKIQCIRDGSTGFCQLLQQSCACAYNFLTKHRCPITRAFTLNYYHKNQYTVRYLTSLLTFVQQEFSCSGIFPNGTRGGNSWFKRWWILFQKTIGKFW